MILSMPPLRHTACRLQNMERIPLTEYALRNTPYQTTKPESIMRHICKDPNCGCEEAVVFAESSILVEPYRDEHGNVKLKPLGVEGMNNVMKALVANDAENVRCAKCNGPMRVIHDQKTETQRRLTVEEIGRKILEEFKI